MRAIALLSLALVGSCILDGGKRGEPVFRQPPLQSFVQVRVVAVVVVDTGNPDVPSPRYAYSSLESFDTTGMMLPLGVVVGVARVDNAGPTGSPAFPYEREKQWAFDRAVADVLRRAGICAHLVEATMQKEGNLYQVRTATVSTSAGLELTAPELAGLCTGGPLP